MPSSVNPARRRATRSSYGGAGTAYEPQSRMPGLARQVQSPWTRSPWNPLVTSESPRLLEALLAVGLMVESMQVPGLGIPLPEGMMILLLLLAGFRPPRRDLSRYGLLTVVALGLLTYLVAVTLVQDLDPTRRAVRIGLLMLFVYALASERIDIKSILYGMAAGGLVNVPLFYAGLVPDNYGGYLTGWLADKNVSGLFYALIPVLLVATMQRMGPKLLVLGVGFLLVFLTGSRTSLAALGCAVVWILLSPYLGRVLRLVLLAGMARFVGWAEEYLADAAIFGDRSGTDWFRDRIQTESARMVDAAPWYGEGLGTAQVHLDNVTMFFHNSYLALLIEGGWPFLIVVVGLYVFLALRPFASTRRSPSRVAVEAAAVIILVASTQLGEVFITIYGAVIVAAGLLLTSQEGDEKDGLTAAERARQRRVGRVMARARRAEGRPVGARQP